MDDFQKAQYRADLAERQVMDLQQQLQNQQLMQVRFERISAMASKTGVPFEVLNQAAEPEDMVIIVADYLNEQAETKANERVKKKQERDAANQVDLGGGGPGKHASDIGERYKKALANGDSRELARIAIEQQRK